jgi:hypothetical protein
LLNITLAYHKKQMVNVDGVCDNILKINLKIRYVGIYYQGAYFSKTKPGMQSLLKEDEIKTSVVNAVKRWETRLVLAKSLGDAIYSMTKYEKVNRITFPIGEDGLILVSTEQDLDPNSISDEILNIRKKSFNIQ